jgi:thymidylate kinase
MNRIEIPQSLIILDGMTGAGKTTATKNLSGRISRLVMVGMDRIKFNISDFERGPRDNGIAKKAVFAMAKVYLEEGLSVCVEQTVKSAEELESYRNLATEFSIPVHEFQLIADPETAFARVKTRQKGNPPEKQVPDERIRRNIEFAQSKKDWGFKVIDTTNIDPARVLNEIIQRLEGNEYAKEMRTETEKTNSL